MSAKDRSEWWWAFSFYGIENWSLLRTRAYVRGWGLGLNSPVELDILQKLFYLCKGDQLFSHTFCLLIFQLNAKTWNTFAGQFQGILQMGQKVITRFWWESELPPTSRNHLTTFYRPFFHYACLRLCSKIVHFIRNSCLYFVCFGWKAHALTALAALPIYVAW